jgi:hypothetical protein
MKREWTTDEVIEQFTLLEDEQEFVIANTPTSPNTAPPAENFALDTGRNGPGNPHRVMGQIRAATLRTRPILKAVLHDCPLC